MSATKLSLGHLKAVAASALIWASFPYSLLADEPKVPNVLPEVIYGDDNRKDLFDTTNSPMMVELARSTAVLVKNASVTIDDTQATMSYLPTETFGESFGLCTTEPFFEQPNPGFCSGFLVGKDIFVTAGHCITSESDCAETSMIFDFALRSADDVPTHVKNANIYGCKEIIAQKYGMGTKTDYAVVRLDREVTGRTPLPFRKTGVVATNTKITVIGHPSGIPTKISGGAAVRTSDEHLPYFVANLDTYGGNSGSAVFNDTTGEVEGILVRGETDFVTRGHCRVSNVCASNSCRGEDVTRATEFASFVP